MSNLVVWRTRLPPQTVGTVLCCICGVSTLPSRENMCVRCLRSAVEITEGLPRLAALLHCPECRCYFGFSFQSLTLLLKQRNARIAKADFVGIELHSKRIKLRLCIQKTLVNGAILEQYHLLEFIQHDNLCKFCTPFYSNPDQWVAVVQVRQHGSHHRTFFYLEQLLLRHGAAARATLIKEADDGVNFFFGNPRHALKFVYFISNSVPVKSKLGKKLVFHDKKRNIYYYKHTFSVEICPICREDLICLPPKLANDLGNLGPVVLCTDINNVITLLDPLTLRSAYLDAKQYWTSPFSTFLSSRQLVEYIVLDIEMDSSGIAGNGSKYASAYMQVARLSDFGKNDNIFIVKTHIGNLLNLGDYALGYDLCGANVDNTEINKYSGINLPQVILVKKSYEEVRQKRHRMARSWKLKRLNVQVDITAKGRSGEEKRAVEYEQFLRDLEENTEMRSNVSLYHNKNYQPSKMVSTFDGDDLSFVSFDELIADLTIDDDEKSTE